MKRVFMMVLTLMFMLSMVWTVIADDPKPDSDLKKTADKMMDLYGNGKLAEMIKARKQIKDAGLSYQPSLTLPLEGLTKSTNQDALAVLVGMYWADAGYARLFNKPKESKAIAEVVRTQVYPRLSINQQISSLGRIDQKIITKMIENPKDPKAQDEMIQAINKRIEKHIELSKTDTSVMVFTINQVYGTLVEGLYQVFSLAVNEKSGPEITKLFNQQADNISRFMDLMNTLVENELAKLADGQQRISMIAPIRDIIMKNKGKLSQDDMKSILADVTEIRNSYLNLCKEK